MQESPNDLIRKLGAAVNETKRKSVWRDAFMMFQMRLRDEAIRNREEGREEGLTESRKERRMEGRMEGWHEKTIQTVEKMILKGYTDKQISEINELSHAEVVAIRANMAR